MCGKLFTDKGKVVLKTFNFVTCRWIILFFYFFVVQVKRHVLTHSDEKKFSCLWCPYRTKIDSNLRKHCRARHNEEYPPLTRNKVVPCSSDSNVVDEVMLTPAVSRSVTRPRLTIATVDGTAVQLTPSPSADNANMQVMLVDPSTYT